MKTAKEIYMQALQAEEAEDMEHCLELMNQAADLGSQDALDWLKDYYFDDDARTQAWS